MKVVQVTFTNALALIKVIAAGRLGLTCRVKYLLWIDNKAERSYGLESN